MMAAQQAEVDAYGMQEGQAQDQQFDDEEEDPDFAMDDEAEAIIRSAAAARIAMAREEYQEERTNLTLGHGTYTEITE